MASTLSRAQSLAARTVHIKISPTPQNLTESRVVLQELEQKFGEIAVFRSLKYHPISPVQNAITAIFQTASSAKAALDTARHRYGLVLEASPSISFFQGPTIPTPSPEAANTPEEPQPVKEFQLDIWPSDFVHEKYIKSPATNPLYGPFTPVSPDDSMIGGALRKSLPPSPWAKGLMDWETDEVRRKLGFAGLKAEIEGVEYVSEAAPSKNAQQGSYLRRRQRRLMKAAPRVMRGLKALREERLQMEEEQRREEAVGQLKPDDEAQMEADAERGNQQQEDVGKLSREGGESPWQDQEAPLDRDEMRWQWKEEQGQQSQETATLRKDVG